MLAAEELNAGIFSVAVVRANRAIILALQFIGIDLGTTSIKGAVLDLDARALSHITRRPFPPALQRLPRWHRARRSLCDPRAQSRYPLQTRRCASVTIMRIIWGPRR